MRDVLEAHLPYVYRFALQLAGDVHAAQDIAQETMLRAWRGRARLREGRAAKRWLLTIAANIWRDQLRRTRKHPMAALVDGAEPPAREQPVGQAAAGEEAVELVRAAIERLPPRQRQVLHLHVFERLSLEEIAEVLSITTVAAKASLFYARQTLRQRLGACDPAREATR